MGEKKKPKNKKSKKASKIFKIIGLMIIFFILTGAVGAGALAYSYIKSAPELDVNDIKNLHQVSTIYDSNGDYMDEVPTLKRRHIVSINDMPQYLKDAFVSIEDERFEKHNGIDLRRIAGVIYIDAKKFLAGDRNYHGASTITQQLIKNTVLTNEVRLKRKVQEMYLALELEKQLSKEQILEAYLNTISLGSITYGVEAASQYYFDKSVSEINIVEAAYLASTAQNPVSYNAFAEWSIKDPSIYTNRTKTVLSKMLELEKISQEEYDSSIEFINSGALTEQFAQIIADRSESSQNALNYEWFSRPVIAQVRDALKKTYKYTDEEVDDLLYLGGLKIYTTMDRELQDYTQKTLNEYSRLVAFDKAVDKTNDNTLLLQASAVIMDYRTGEVKAMVGGRGEQPPNSYNRANINYLRPAGSAIKPLTTYLPAIDTKLATAATVYEDARFRGEIDKAYKKATGTDYVAKNSPNAYDGYMNLREGLKHSKNTIAQQLSFDGGVKLGLAYADKLGIFFSDKDRTSYVGVSIGEFEGTNTLKMAAAYGIFGNSGVYTAPILFTQVVDKTGKVILEASAEQHSAATPQAAYILYDMLKEPIKTTGKNASLGSMPTAGKTGTTQENKNLWFAGLSPHYSAAVWLGRDDSKTLDILKNNNLGSFDAAAIWGQIMKKANEGLSTTDIPKPGGIVTKQVCSISGHLPTELCHIGHDGKSSVVTEYFIEGTVPTTLCETHVQAEINTSNNKLATENTPDSLRALRVFITRDYVPDYTVTDQKYVLPKDLDDTPSVVIPEIPRPGDDAPGDNGNPPGNGNNPGNGNGPGSDNGNGNGNRDNP